MTDLPPGAPTPWAAPPAGTVTVYRGATLFDGTGDRPRADTTIVTDGDRIHAVVGDGDPLPPLAADAPRVDLDGRFVVPGLIDTHQHLATPPDRPVAEAVLRRLVHSGVTAVRDMADDLRQIGDLARATLVGEIPGPDIRYAALMAGPSFFDDPRTHEVSRGSTPGAVPWMQAVTPDTDLTIAVALARGTHAAAIKVYADLDATTVAAVTAEAHRQGIAVWAHATVFPAAPGEVVAAGVDSVSHVTLLAFENPTEPLSSYKSKPPVDHDRFATGDDPRLAALFAEMRRRGTVLDATASMWTSDELRATPPNRPNGPAATPSWPPRSPPRHTAPESASAPARTSRPAPTTRSPPSTANSPSSSTSAACPPPTSCARQPSSAPGPPARRRTWAASKPESSRTSPSWTRTRSGTSPTCAPSPSP
jgi:hypothetical protein